MVCAGVDYKENDTCAWIPKRILCNLCNGIFAMPCYAILGKQSLLCFSWFPWRLKLEKKFVSVGVHSANSVFSEII